VPPSQPGLRNRWAHAFGMLLATGTPPLNPLCWGTSLFYYTARSASAQIHASPPTALEKVKYVPPWQKTIDPLHYPTPSTQTQSYPDALFSFVDVLISRVCRFR